MFTIAVSGINATDNPGPGLPVAKSLKESDLPVKTIGLSYDVNDPGHYVKDYLDYSFILPFPTKGWEGIKKRLLEIKKLVGLDLIIPCLDAELPLFIQYAKELAEEGIKTFLPDKELFALREKENLEQVAGKIGITYPKTIAVFDLEQLDAAISRFGFPVMVKGPYYKAAKVTDYPAAHYNFNCISAEWGFPILVQQVVSGEEFNVIGLGSGDGDDMGMVAIKKTTITNLGKIWSGVTIYHEGMLAAARKFVEDFKWKGPFELECIVDKDQIYLIEINPRFPAWAYFATGVGINLAERLAKQVLLAPEERPQNYKNSKYDAGKLFMRYTDEKVLDIDVFQNLVTKGQSHIFKPSSSDE
ncbi:MAG: ATP-grasp domain-containing protein [Candidatus Riflebacteria bacterium]